MNLIIICIALEVLLYIIWYVYCFLQCPKSAILITSAEIVIPFIYLIYSIVAPIFFVIEGKSLADRYFYISTNTMQKSCLLYLGIYFSFLLLLYLFNAVKRLKRRKVEWIKEYAYPPISIWWDFIAIAIICYYAIKIIYADSSWAGLDTLDKRAYVSSEYVSYLNIYMVAYTNKMIIPWIIKGKNCLHLYNFRLIIPVSFWGIYLIVTSRRYFLMVFPAVFMALVAAECKEKLTKKWLYYGSVAIVLLLIMGAKRAFLSLSKATFVYYMHNTFAEFIYTYYTGCFFIGHNYELQYGKTYIFDSLTQWIPRFIFPDKPLDMSVRFWNMAHTNVAYSFSPVAEGIYNFGWGALFVVPIILMLYVWMTNFFKKYSNVLYLTTVAGFVGFMRGNISNCLMDFFMITVLMMLMNIHGNIYKIYLRKEI